MLDVAAVNGPLRLLVAVAGPKKWHYMEPGLLAGREPVVVSAHRVTASRVEQDAGEYCPITFRPPRTGMSANFTGSKSTAHGRKGDAS